MDMTRTDSRGGRLPHRIAKSPERWLRKLRRWKSLPTSQLAPSNRPLFVCRTCAANNTHGIICTWCGDRCDRLPGIRAVRRRVSEPKPLNDMQKEQLRKIQQYAATLVVGSKLPVVPTSEPRDVRRKMHRDAMVLSMDGVNGVVRTQHKTTRKFFVRSVIPHDVDMTPPQSPTSPVSTASSTTQPSEDKPGVNVSLPADNTPRTLRRRKHFSLPKRRSTSSIELKVTEPSISIVSFPSHTIRSKAAPAPAGATTPSPPASPTRSARSATFSKPYRTVGPLYNSIRPGFSATNLAVTAHSLRSVTSHEERSTSPAFFSEEEELDDAFSQLSAPYAARGHMRSMSGCSVSGEAELQIALSRRRRNTVGGAEYRFPGRGDGEEKQGTSIMLTVKRIGLGLKSLVRTRG